MRVFIWGLVAAVLLAGGAAAATLSDAKIGFTADRLLIVNGKTYHGKMWNMPGKERHHKYIHKYVNGSTAILFLFDTIIILLDHFI